jgi:membrane protease YdiL (CAAX protease family)
MERATDLEALYHCDIRSMTVTIVRALALMVSLAAFVRAVVRVREPHTFPLATLMNKWFPQVPSLDHLLIGAGAGIAAVIVVPMIGLLGGWEQITLTEPVTGRWVGLAIAGVAVKTLFVVFEELIFRGALVSQLRRWTGSGIAVSLSALIFAAAHTGRSRVDTAILFADGIGFALAFVMTESLWVPAFWHISKNLSVWLCFGSGTIDLTPGPFAFEQLGSGPVLGSSERAGLLDLGVTILIVGLITWRLIRRRANAIKAG